MHNGRNWRWVLAKIGCNRKVRKPDAHNTGAESNTKPAREKQGALVVATDLTANRSESQSSESSCESLNYSEQFALNPKTVQFAS